MKKPLKVNLKARGKLHIFPVSDLHVGSRHFNEDYFKYCRQKIKLAKGEIVVYLLGDIMEVAGKSVGNASFQQDMDVNEQLDYACKLLKPIKNYIRWSVPGNHDSSRTKKDFDLDIGMELAKRLKIPYSQSIFDELIINNNSFTVYGVHGRGSSRYSYTSMSKFIRETNHIDANLYLMGHLHRSMFFSEPYISVNGLYRRNYCFTGHFLSYKGSYAEEMNLQHLPESFSHITIDRNSAVNCKHYFSDIENYCNKEEE